VRRRDFIKSASAVSVAFGLTILVFGSPDHLSAQTAKAKIAVLDPFSPPESGFEAFRGALRDLGYIEGQNLIIEIRWAHGRLERLPQLAAELVPLKPEVIFAPGEQGLRAAKEATTDIPIVTVACDPLDKLIKSLARPGGNATGLSCVHSELAGKRLEMLKELMPSLSRVAVLYNPGEPNKLSEFAQLEAAGRRLGVTVHAFEVANAEGIEPAFTSMASLHVQSVMVLVDAFTIFHRKKLADLALERHLVSVSGFKEFVEAGHVLSYGANRSALFRRAAAYVGQILKGTNAGELPVEEPTIFELYINKKAADSLEVIIPPSLLLRADKVLE
jgi:putative ABC transport system substrate-binding protein